jgi:hypothetical protein
MKKRKDSCLSILLLLAFLFCTIGVYSMNSFYGCKHQVQLQEHHHDYPADISLYAEVDEDDSFDSVKDLSLCTQRTDDNQYTFTSHASAAICANWQRQLKIKERSLVLTYRRLRI